MSGRRRNISARLGAAAAESHPATEADAPLIARTNSEVEHLRRVVAQLMHTAAHDPLTGLPTRRLLLERLDEELARDADGLKIAVLFVDLDNFKLVNDSLGHGRDRKSVV